MQLSQALDGVLCQRYPALYADRKGDVRDTAMAWGFEIGAGWFGIVDGLSEILSASSETGQTPCPMAQQVKQDFGTLRFHLQQPHGHRGAIALAEEMSRRTCEVTGWPGRLCTNDRRRVATLAPGVSHPQGGAVRRLDEAGGGRVEAGFALPPLAFNLADIVRVRADVLGGPVGVPVGWFELADAVLSVVQQVQDQSALARVRHIWVDGTDLRLDLVGGTAELAGLEAAAAAISRRIDPITGAVATAAGQHPV